MKDDKPFCFCYHNFMHGVGRFRDIAEFAEAFVPAIEKLLDEFGIKKIGPSPMGSVFIGRDKEGYFHVNGLSFKFKDELDEWLETKPEGVKAVATGALKQVVAQLPTVQQVCDNITAFFKALKDYDAREDAGRELLQAYRDKVKDPAELYRALTGKE